MCLDCGCHRPTDDHGDSRHITIADLVAAALASKITLAQAVANISSTVSQDVKKKA